jgi:hypothetical protein
MYGIFALQYLHFQEVDKNEKIGNKSKNLRGLLQLKQ